MSEAPEKSGIGEAFPSSPEVSGTRFDEGDNAYRPLSLLALLSLVAAVLYAGVLLVVGGAAFINKSPFLLPPWSLIFPLGIVFLAWIARNQILNSEGTKSGLAMAKWAIGIPLIVGLTYAAYYGATYVAITRQARAFVDDWLVLVREDKLTEAYWLTAPPPRRDPSDLREAVEIMLNSDLGLINKGKFTEFGEFEFVRLALLGGEETKIEYQGVHSWEHEAAGYRVRLNYRLSNSLGHADVVVSVLGIQSPTGEFRGRQWQVVMQETGLPMDVLSSVTYSEEGQQIVDVTRRVIPLVMQWITDLSLRDQLGAFLLTVEPDKRPLYKERGPKWTLQALAAGFGTIDTDEKQQYTIDQSVYNRDILKREPGSEFWSNSVIRERLFRRFGEFLDGKLPQTPQTRVERTGLPFFEKEADKITKIRLDVHLQLPNDKPQSPPFILMGLVTVDTSEGVENAKIVSFDLSHGRTAQNLSGGPGG